jgi:hypothetical protein
MDSSINRVHGLAGVIPAALMMMAGSIVPFGVPQAILASSERHLTRQAALVMTVPCGTMGQHTPLSGEPVGEGGEGVMVERASSPTEAPRLHVDATAGLEFSRFSSMSSISIGYPEGRGDARGVDVLQAGRVRFHACLVGMNSRRLLASTWVAGQPATVDTRTLSAAMKQGLDSMRISDARLLLLSETLGGDARVFTGGQGAEPVALYLVAIGRGEN